MNHVIVFIIIFLLAIAIVSIIARRSKFHNDANKFGGGKSASRRRHEIKYSGVNMRQDVVKDLDKNPRSKSEAAVIQELETLLGAKFPSVNPSWLVWGGKTLELDGYNSDLGIALEFSGPMHTKWSPRDETYVKYFDRICKDVVKRKLCKKNGVVLIVVDCGLPMRHIRAWIKSRLADAGRMEKDYDYIPDQTAEVYRNAQLEAELHLGGMMALAESL